MSALPAKYWAFISYNHRDAKIAATLQRMLETYRVPQRLVGTRTTVGEVPARLKPVFRDRDELQASTDLRAVVLEALAQSRYLIVICSPDSARSEWVTREIIELTAMLTRRSAFGNQLAPPFVLFQMPPATPAAHITSGVVG